MEKSIEQLKFYPAATRFTIKAKNFNDGRIKILKDISLDDYLKSLKYLKYLKYLNVQGYNVFLSPKPLAAGGVVDILLDDVKESTIRQLEKDGFELLYYLETSPLNFQAIIRLSTNSYGVDKQIHTFISRQLAELYNADINSSDIGHFFRLAGFSNRKEKYRSENNNLYPFVKLFSSRIEVATKGEAYISQIIEGIQSGFIELPSSDIATPPATQGEKAERKTSSSSGCFEYVRKVYSGNDKAGDISSLDFKAAYYALRKSFSPDEIKAAIVKYSPDIQSRKNGHVDDYLDRTLKNALARL